MAFGGGSVEEIGDHVTLTFNFDGTAAGERVASGLQYLVHFLSDLPING